MADSTDESSDGSADPVTFKMEIEDGKTSIRVSGDRDSAVVVRSGSGEKIYLPPEELDRQAAATSYESPYESRSGAQESPYQSSPDPAGISGLEPRGDGYLIVHPEPVEDVRFLR